MKVFIFYLLVVKILLLGSTGYVGGWIDRYLMSRGHSVVSVRIEVRDRGAVMKALKEVVDPQSAVGGVDVVINATGKTGSPNVDWCEDHRLETVGVNVLGALNVAEVCADLGLHMVQIGSGCIFTSGEVRLKIKNEKGKNTSWEDDVRNRGLPIFSEENKPNFFGSFYSQTKAVCEGALSEFGNVCVLRIRMPLSAEPHPKNLLTKLLKYERIISLPNSVTILEDLMPLVEKVCERKISGVVNAVNPGVYEHRELLELYGRMVEGGRNFDYFTEEEFQGVTKAERSNCVLSTRRSRDLTIEMPEVHGRLAWVVEEYIRRESGIRN